MKIKVQNKACLITGSYDLDIVEEAFDVALKVDLTFKFLINVKAWCFNCDGYGHYDYQCPSESQHVRIVMMLMTRKLLRMSTFFLSLLV